MEEVKDEPFVVMARTASIPGHDFIWKTAADAGFAPHVVAEATHVPGSAHLGFLRYWNLYPQR